jgi:hypothetical protein
LSKVFGIASSVCLIGLLFVFLHLPGAKEQLMIGLLSLAVSGVMLLFLIVTAKKAEGRTLNHSLRGIGCTVA